jgi:hypothetical protein
MRPASPPFLIAVSTDENLDHPTLAIIEPVKSFDNDSLTDWAKRCLACDAEVYSMAMRGPCREPRLLAACNFHD